MKRRSDLSVIIEQLQRLVNQGGGRWCILSHGPEPLTNYQIKLKDGNVYDERVLAYMLPKVELQYTESAYTAIRMNYLEFKEEFFSKNP